MYSVEAAGQGRPITVTVLVALLVCLIPTTIGGLLSAIGIAGMDRMIQANVIAMSGRAVEAAGDVDVLLLGQDRHDHAGQSPGRRVHSCAGVCTETHWPMRHNWLRWPTKRRRAAASSCWPKRNTDLRGRNVHELRATFIPFSAQTRMSGVNFDGRQNSQRGRRRHRSLRARHTAAL